MNDTEESVNFYVQHLGFELLFNAGPFAMIKRDDLTILVSGPKTSVAQPMPYGRVIEHLRPLGSRFHQKQTVQNAYKFAIILRSRCVASEPWIGHNLLKANCSTKAVPKTFRFDHHQLNPLNVGALVIIKERVAHFRSRYVIWCTSKLQGRHQVTANCPQASVKQ